jgi:protein CWC15
MTTAHRPTFRPAQGGGGKYDAGASISKQYSSRDIVSHTELKLRQPGQASEAELAIKDLRAELERREAQAAQQRKRDEEQRAGLNAISADTASGKPAAITGSTTAPAIESAAAPEAKRARLTHIQPNALDADDDIGGGSNDGDQDDDDDSDDDDDDTAQLLAELEKIKKERAEEQARKETEREAHEEQVRRENILQGNPLLRDKSTSSDFTVKRRWDDDVVFKNCAKPEEKNKKSNFVNDTLRSEYHRRFMEKFINY